MVSDIALIYTFNYLFFLLSVHFILVEVYRILHHDISINNILIYICDTAWTATLHDQQERCHTPNTFGTVNMEHTIDSSLSWSER